MRVLLLLALSAAPLAAQGTDPLARAMRAYQDLEYDSAASYFRGALASPLTDADQLRALMHLGATELFRDRRDSAASAFRRLVLLDPRYRPDNLRFPPEVSSLFQEIRLVARAVRPVVPEQTRIGAPGERLQVRLYASGVHEISAVIAYPQATGRTLRTLHQGGIGDSLELLWDGRDSAGARADSGAYVLRIISRNAELRPIRRVDVPLNITRGRIDTLPLPPPPPDSLLRPETTPGSGGGRQLLTGLLAAGATIVLPSLVSGESGGMPSRYAVAGALGVAGIAGLLRARRPRPLPENMAWNQQIRDRWEREVARVRADNDAMRREQALIIRAGTPVVTELR